jgi:type II secretory ATPase GspE/PulE/Tfp pilus assembly ATPase PilB-like protein
LGLFRKEKAPVLPSDDIIALDALPEALIQCLNQRKNGIPDTLDQALMQGVLHGASDIHFESWPDCLALSYRIDGKLHDVARIPKNFQSHLISRIKVLAKMLLYNKGMPQDGRIEAEATRCGRTLRVSTFPTVSGEQAVLRVSDKPLQRFTLDTLGFHGSIGRRLRDVIFRPQGALFLTGPSSSGKTTTIYALLHELLEKSKSDSTHFTPHIVTLEDPVENTMRHISQAEIQPQGEFNYQAALRSVLRQDPDVIVVGETRDPETAHAAIQAGLTGHLVITTIHSGTTTGVFARLLDMGIEPFLIASTITGVLAQRLVRRNCQECNTPYEPGSVLLKRFGLARPTGDAGAYQRGSGCEACQGLGYQGRTVIGEMLAMNDELGDLILNRAPSRDMFDAAIRNKMIPMVDHGLKKAQSGRTTLEELNRVLPPPDDGSTPKSSVESE